MDDKNYEMDSAEEKKDKMTNEEGETEDWKKSEVATEESASRPKKSEENEESVDEME